MKIFKDILSDDELFSDAKRVEKDLDVCKGLWRIPVKRISESNAVDDSVFGGNASAEGEDAGDAAADGDTVGLDVVLIHKLEAQESYFTPDKAGKAAFKGYFPKYCKALKKKLEDNGEKEKAAQWEKTAKSIFKFMFDNWSDIALFGGSSFDPAEPELHSVCFVTYDNSSGLEDYMYFIEYSLLEEKV